MLLSQLLCTLSCILLTSMISISFQPIQPSPAMNQNLEGSQFSVLRKKPFDKVVMDARQSGLGWVPFFDWHYTFMMQTNEEARAWSAGAERGLVRGTGGVGFDLGGIGIALLCWNQRPVREGLVLGGCDNRPHMRSLAPRNSVTISGLLGGLAFLGGRWRSPTL